MKKIQFRFYLSDFVDNTLTVFNEDLHSEILMKAAEDFTKKYVGFNGYITIELDTETKVATIIPEE